MIGSRPFAYLSWSLMTDARSALWHSRHIAAFGTLAMATSGFGQTFFVAVFGAEIRGAFELSHTAYGTLYSLATICSAALLLRAGRWADDWPLARAAAVAVLLLAGGCLLVGLAPHAAVLALGFFLIRFGGQGLIAHLAIVSAGRYFREHRGKAVALAAMGIPLAEASLPIAGAFLLGLGGWRLPWGVAAAVLLVVALPLLIGLARRAGPAPDADVAQPQSATDVGEPRHFTRGEALRDPGLYLLLPAVLAGPFIITAILFHQTAIAELRDWPLERVAAAFTTYAAGHLAMLLVAGGLVDRLGAHRSLPLALLPMAVGLTVLSVTTADWAPFAYLGLTGLSQGWIATTSGAIWPERYGTRHLGAIRSVAQATMVVATAAAPLLLGFLLDAGWSVGAIGTALTAGTLAVALLAAFAPAPAQPGRLPR